MKAYLGSNRLVYPIVNLRLLTSISFIASSASLNVGAIGFSIITCFLAFSAARTIGKRSDSGVEAIIIASIDSFSIKFLIAL